MGGLVTGWDTTDYAALGDGGMVEGFGAWGNGNYFSPDDWSLQMDRILDLARRDKIIICQSYTSDYNIRERMFLAGCYLLVKGNHTYFNMIGAEHGEELLYYPEYTIPIGSYQGEIPGGINELYDSASGCFRRAYSNGEVLVNPFEADIHIGNLYGAHQLVAARGGGAVDAAGGYSGNLSYRAVTSVDLPAHSAAILLSEAPATKHTVTLSLDKALFSQNDALALYWQLTPAPEAPSNVADAYVACMTPRGELYFYKGDFSRGRISIAPSLLVTDRAGTLGPFLLAGLPAGDYRWYAVLVIRGGDPRRASNWLSNLGAIPFSINAAGVLDDSLHHS